MAGVNKTHWKCRFEEANPKKCLLKNPHSGKLFLKYCFIISTDAVFVKGIRSVARSPLPPGHLAPPHQIPKSHTPPMIWHPPPIVLHRGECLIKGNVLIEKWRWFRNGPKNIKKWEGWCRIGDVLFQHKRTFIRCPGSGGGGGLHRRSAGHRVLTPTHHTPFVGSLPNQMAAEGRFGNGSQYEWG